MNSNGKVGSLSKDTSGKLVLKKEKKNDDRVYCPGCEKKYPKYSPNFAMKDSSTLYTIVTTIHNLTFYNPFCHCCDLKYPTFLPTAKVADYKRIHEIALTIPKQYLQDIPRCKKPDSFRWDVYQIKCDYPRGLLIFKFMFENLLSMTFGMVRFDPDYHLDKQFFIAVKQAKFGNRNYRILGYCMVGLKINFQDLTYSVLERNNDKETSPPDKLEVEFFWVHLPNRLKGVASSMVDAARNHFFDVRVAPKDQVSLMCPTTDGSAFSSRYFAKNEY